MSGSCLQEKTKTITVNININVTVSNLIILFFITNLI